MFNKILDITKNFKWKVVSYGRNHIQMLTTVLSYTSLRISPQAFNDVCDIPCTHILSPQMDSFYLCDIFHLRNSKPIISTAC